MDVSSVSLQEVLAAASLRAASLVPETSGYLALAIADASARLPFRLDDEMVTLTTEGSVAVARGAQVVSPAESARTVRDMLARLLACSIGSAPALFAAARPRHESDVGVEAVIRELEAALVPVNRAAARRALARLAREAFRAKEGGKLKRRRSRRPSPNVNLDPMEVPVVRAPAAPAKVALEESIDVQFSASPVPVSPAPREVEPEPRQEVLELLDEAATTIDAPVAPAPARARDRARLMSADVSCARSDVDDLLARFGVSSLVTPETMQSTRASLKRLAGLDPTPPPPSAAELRKLTARPPRVELFRMRESQREEVLATLPDRAALRPTTVALVALGLVLAGLLGHYLPPWLEQLTATSVDTAP